MNLQTTINMIDVRMLLDITPSVGLPVVSFCATGSQIVSLIAAFMGLIYTGMRMYSWVDDRRKAKKEQSQINLNK